MAVRPEMIGDVEEGAAPENGARDELGLTAEERTAWDAMQAPDAPSADGEAAPEDATPAPAEALARPESEALAEGEDDADDVQEIVPDPKSGKTPQKVINYSKHQRELKKRDDRLAATEQLLRTESENRIKLAERLSILNEALTAPVPVDPVKAQEAAVAANPFLEPDIDIAEDALAAIAQTQRRQKWQNEHFAQTNETTQATLEDRQLKDDFQRDADGFKRTDVGQHFDAAYQFLKDSRLTELGISLFDKDPNDPNEIFTQAQINRLVGDFNTEEKWVVANARKEGKSPSAVIMKLAKGRGFKPQAAVPAPSAATTPAVISAKNGNGAAPGATSSAVAKILAETESAAASRSLSDGGGAPPPVALTQEVLLRMNDDEFAAYVDSFPGQVASLMGKPAPGRAA